MKMTCTTSVWIGVILAMITMAGCGRTPNSEEEAPSPSNSYALNEADLAEKIAAAEKGDVSAMNRLVEYYLINQDDDERGWYWLERAAEACDADARNSVLSHYAGEGSQEKKAHGELLREKWGMK